MHTSCLQSYTPKKISVWAGNAQEDLVEVHCVDLHEPAGWINCHVHDRDQNNVPVPLRARMLQISVTSMHQHGRDAHIRQCKVSYTLYKGVRVINNYTQLQRKLQLLQDTMLVYCSRASGLDMHAPLTECCIAQRTRALLSAIAHTACFTSVIMQAHQSLHQPILLHLLTCSLVLCSLAYEQIYSPLHWNAQLDRTLPPCTTTEFTRFATVR
jgi:Anaphase-promoting complex, subunit 10 (APC10)